MTRLRCVTMQRDETDQLEGWLGHHGYLAGFENLTVFDNGSTERRTIEILRRFARVGTRVIWEHRQDDDYAARDIHFDNLSRQWSGEAAATVGVLLEADERLALFSAHGLSCRRSEIEACLARPFADGESFTLDLGLRACADHPGFFRAEPLARRLVVRGDVGSAEAAGAAGRLEDLTVVATGLDGIGGESAALVGLGPVAALAAALELPGGAGAAAGLVLRFAARQDGKSEALFDGGRYLELNPDVAAAGWPALKHYLMRGHWEDRRVG